MLPSILLALALPCVAAEPRVGAAEPAPSMAARPAIANSWSVELGHGRRGSRVAMSYRVRWDFSDLRAAPARVAGAASRPAALLASGARGLLRGVRLELYGVRLRPFRGSAAQAPEAVGAGVSVAAVARAAVDPVLQDLRVDARRELRSFLIRSFFDRSLPQATGAPAWEKEAVVAGLLSIGRVWAAR